MSALWRVCSRSSGLWVLAFLVAGLWTQTPACADEVVSINVDQAHLLNLPDRVATIVARPRANWSKRAEGCRGV